MATATAASTDADAEKLLETGLVDELRPAGRPALARARKTALGLAVAGTLCAAAFAVVQWTPQTSTSSELDADTDVMIGLDFVVEESTAKMLELADADKTSCLGYDELGDKLSRRPCDNSTQQKLTSKDGLLTFVANPEACVAATHAHHHHYELTAQPCNEADEGQVFASSEKYGLVLKAWPTNCVYFGHGNKFGVKPCADHVPHMVPPLHQGSCKDRHCSHSHHHSCQCDHHCAYWGRCCADVSDYCEVEDTGPPVVNKENWHGSSTIGGDVLTLYHTTSHHIAKKILSEGFKMGTRGWCGAGVYFIDHPHLPRTKFGKRTVRGAIIETKVAMGRIAVRENYCKVHASGHFGNHRVHEHGPQVHAAEMGYDSIVFKQHDGTEWFIWDPEQILSLSLHKWYKHQRDHGYAPR